MFSTEDEQGPVAARFSRFIPRIRKLSALAHNNKTGVSLMRKCSSTRQLNQRNRGSFCPALYIQPTGPSMGGGVSENMFTWII